MTDTAHFTAKKVGRARTNIFDWETGEFVCQLRNTEVDSWLFRAERAKADDEIDARSHRTERAREYLTRRAARPVQLGLF